MVQEILYDMLNLLEDLGCDAEKKALIEKKIENLNREIERFSDDAQAIQEKYRKKRREQR